MKDIKGYEGLYAITEDGRVWSYITKRYLKQMNDKDGYLQVNLYKNRQCNTKKVHRLVADAYLDNPENKPQVNHKDENPKNNNVNNLEWATNEENQNHGNHNLNMGKSKSKSVRCIETGIVYYGAKEAERQTEINQSSISRCCKGKQKTAMGYHWEYVEE